MSAPDWQTIPGMIELSEQREANGAAPFTQPMFDYLWNRAGSRNVPPESVLAILPQEGTGSFDTSSNNKAADGGNGFEADWERDVDAAVDLLEGKLALYAQACAQGWKRLACQVISPGDDDNLQADGMPDQWMNWLSAIVRPDGSINRGVYAQHASWWVGVRRYYLQYGGTLDELERCAMAMDRRAPRVSMAFEYVEDNTDLASNWNATAPEPAVVCTAAVIMAPAPEIQRVPVTLLDGSVSYGEIHADERTYVWINGDWQPIRKIAEAMGAVVHWVSPQEGGPRVELRTPEQGEGS